MIRQVPIAANYIYRDPKFSRVSGAVELVPFEGQILADQKVTVPKTITLSVVGGTLVTGSTVPTVSPDGLYFTVKERFAGGREPYIIHVAPDAEVVDLATDLPVVPPPELVTLNESLAMQRAMNLVEIAEAAQGAADDAAAASQASRLASEAARDISLGARDAASASAAQSASSASAAAGSESAAAASKSAAAASQAAAEASSQYAADRAAGAAGSETAAGNHATSAAGSALAAAGSAEFANTAIANTAILISQTEAAALFGFGDNITVTNGTGTYPSAVITFPK